MIQIYHERTYQCIVLLTLMVNQLILYTWIIVTNSSEWNICRKYNWFHLLTKSSAIGLKKSYKNSKITFYCDLSNGCLRAIFCEAIGLLQYCASCVSYHTRGTALEGAVLVNTPEIWLTPFHQVHAVWYFNPTWIELNRWWIINNLRNQRSGRWNWLPGKSILSTYFFHSRLS